MQTFLTPSVLNLTQSTPKEAKFVVPVQAVQGSVFLARGYFLSDGEH